MRHWRKRSNGGLVDGSASADHPTRALTVLRMPRPSARAAGLLALALTASLALASCAKPRPATAVTSRSGLTYTVLSRGTGEQARPGQYVTIHETTSFVDGRVHFSTAGGKPIRFLLGGGQVIDGLEEGVTCMQVGERRMLVVPPSLSRRSSYPPNLSPDDTLHYDVTLVAIEKKKG